MQSRGSNLQASRMRKLTLNIVCRQQATLLDSLSQYRWPDLVILTTFQQLHLEHRPSLQLLKAAVQLSHAGSA